MLSIIQIKNHTKHYVLDTQPPSVGTDENYVQHYTYSSGKQNKIYALSYIQSTYMRTFR
jgi:hypothetical protein